MPYVYLAVHDAACIAATVVFVLTGHPWWTIATLVPFALTYVKPVPRK